jgi:geranylgeranylglycerol-phosphate geranylgeranyltransferase
MKLSKKLIFFFQIPRPLNCLIVFLVIIVASVISIDGDYVVLNIILAGISGALTTAAGNVINDYFDIDIDKINKPDRVLPSGNLSSKEALYYYIALIMSALTISFFININAFLIVLIASALLFIYSYRVKKIPLLGNTLISFLTGLAFVYGSIAVNNFNASLIPAVFAFLLNFIREIIKDMEDVEGDKKYGIRTYPVSSGFKKAKIIVVFITSVLIMFLTLYPFIINVYSIEYLLVIMIFVNPILVYILKTLFDDDSVKNLNRISNLLKLNMLIGLTAIFLGR